MLTVVRISEFAAFLALSEPIAARFIIHFVDWGRYSGQNKLPKLRFLFYPAPAETVSNGVGHFALCFPTSSLTFSTRIRWLLSFIAARIPSTRISILSLSDKRLTCCLLSYLLREDSAVPTNLAIMNSGYNAFDMYLGDPSSSEPSFNTAGSSMPQYTSNNYPYLPSGGLGNANGPFTYAEVETYSPSSSSGNSANGLATSSSSMSAPAQPGPSNQRPLQFQIPQFVMPGSQLVAGGGAEVISPMIFNAMQQEISPYATWDNNGGWSESVGHGMTSGKKVCVDYLVYNLSCFCHGLRLCLLYHDITVCTTTPVPQVL